ncbi:hypothetical protein WA845_23275 [Agrobacterium sp. CMT1]|uniref:hypothetical protein n=1 Tax=Agrobacterium sp. CMT1 TaxID=3128901 RepID=UPI003077ACA7
MRNNKALPCGSASGHPADLHPEVADDAVPDLESGDIVTVAHQTPRTRDDFAIRDAVRARLAVVETAALDVVREKVSEGFTLAEIDSLYAVELPLLFGYRIENGRIRAAYDGQIVERSP